MKLRVTPRALAEAKRINTWWRRHREAAPDLFERELEAVLARAVLAPALGVVYEQDDLDVTVRRVLMPRTHHHVYYAVHGDEFVVLSVWGAPKGRGPKLKAP
jgi:plasmid stabilization system protein ParE